MVAVEHALTRFRELVVQEMRDTMRHGQGPLYAMQRYHLGWEDAGGAPLNRVTGKMFRPALLLLSCEAVGADPQQALAAAAAVELVHNFSLIHDDIEDGGHTRHGRRTVWDIWGVANGINAGDSMFTIARLALHRLSAQGCSPQLILNAFLMFDRACQRLCEGQDADLRYEQREIVALDEYMEMIAGKTGALIGVSASLGAALGGAPAATVVAFDRFGRSLGRAFQIQDDVLGIWGVESRTGKPSGDDIRSRKKSYPIVRALETVHPEDRALLLDLYRLPELDGDAVGEVLRVFDRNGIRRDAETAAMAAAREAQATLDQLSLAQPAGGELAALTTFVASREA